MSETGETKEDVKVPTDETGKKIMEMHEAGGDMSKSIQCAAYSCRFLTAVRRDRSYCHGRGNCYRLQVGHKVKISYITAGVIVRRH